MIITSIILLLLVGTISIISLVGSGITFIAGSEDAFYNIGYYLGAINEVFPASDLVTVLLWVVPLVYSIFILRVAFYLVALIRGNSMPR